MAETYAGGVLVLPLVSHVEYVDEASADRRADTQTPDRCFPLWRGPVRVCPNVQFYTKYAVLFLICAGFGEGRGRGKEWGRGQVGGGKWEGKRKGKGERNGKRDKGEEGVKKGKLREEGKGREEFCTAVTDAAASVIVDSVAPGVRAAK